MNASHFSDRALPLFGPTTIPHRLLADELGISAWLPSTTTFHVPAGSEKVLLRSKTAHTSHTHLPSGATAAPDSSQGGRSSFGWAVPSADGPYLAPAGRADGLPRGGDAYEVIVHCAFL